MEPEIHGKEQSKNNPPPVAGQLSEGKVPDSSRTEAQPDAEDDLPREASEELGKLCLENGHEQGRSLRDWSKRALAGRLTEADLPEQQKEWPKNLPLLELLKRKYAHLGFDFELASWNKYGVDRRHVRFRNYPTVDGRSPTLTELFLMDASLADPKREPKKRKRQSNGRDWRGRRNRPLGWWDWTG